MSLYSCFISHFSRNTYDLSEDNEYEMLRDRSPKASNSNSPRSPTPPGPEQPQVPAAQDNLPATKQPQTAVQDSSQTEQSHTVVQDNSEATKQSQTVVVSVPSVAGDEENHNSKASTLSK